ncbi:hypothetical protein RFI_00823, partial [Reticulomyxa filosa]
NANWKDKKMDNVWLQMTKMWSNNHMASHLDNHHCNHNYNNIYNHNRHYSVIYNYNYNNNHMSKQCFQLVHDLTTSPHPHAFITDNICYCCFVSCVRYYSMWSRECVTKANIGTQAEVETDKGTAGNVVKHRTTASRRDEAEAGLRVGRESNIRTDIDIECIKQIWCQLHPLGSKAEAVAKVEMKKESTISIKYKVKVAVKA